MSTVQPRVEHVTRLWREGSGAIEANLVWVESVRKSNPAGRLVFDFQSTMTPLLFESLCFSVIVLLALILAEGESGSGNLMIFVECGSGREVFGFPG